MRLQYTLGALAVSTLASHAMVVATTSFETTDNFAAGDHQTAGNNVTAADGAIWSAGPAGVFAGTWTGQNLTGAQSTVIGNAGHYIAVDAAGAAGVGTIDFSWERYTATNGSLTIQWTTDLLDGGETWTDAETISIAGGAGGGWASESVKINKAGDVKVRLILAKGTTGGASFDDITVNDGTAPPAITQLGRAFADHMVLQRNEPVKIFGADAASQAISVSFAGQVKNTTTDAQGNWEIALDAMTASTTGQSLVVTGSTGKTITDVLIGEVWLAAGQSNMNLRVDQSSTSPHAATYPLIRMCNWEGTVATDSNQVYNSTDFGNLTPENFYAGTWQVMDATTVQAQSAVAYFFAHNLATDLNVPIGIVDTSIGGTSTEAYLSPGGHASSPHLTEAFERPHLCRNLGQWTGARLFKNVYNNNVANYTHADAAKSHPHPYAPGFLYYVGISHLKGFTFKGAIWYQGESNAEFTTGKYQINGNRLSDYQTEVMKTLIADWRTAFGKPNFPFYMVQLPLINAPNRAMWPYYREAQARVAKDVDGCELATVIEYGAAGDVHPSNKEPVGERLAAIARANQYGDAITYSGPVYRSHIVSGNTIILEFDHLGAGLVDNDGGSLRNFEISGNDRRFVPATATIAGNTIVVTAAGVPNPVAVRHAWDMNPDVDLFNGDGFSSSSFRTDKWIIAPGRTIRVACIGDSITSGYGVAPADKYPAQLQEILGTSNFEVRNFGRSGSGIYRVSNRYDNSTQYTEAVAWSPDVVICNLGINDITGWNVSQHAAFEIEYFQLVDTFAQSGSTPLFIQWSNLAPLYPGQAFYQDPMNPDLVILLDWIRQAAASTNSILLDMETPLLSHPEWFPDFIHPNAAGAREIAEMTFCLLDSIAEMDGKAEILKFLTLNTSGLQDEDGAFSDWIELTNTGTGGLCLNDHYLSNDLAHLRLWQIPSSTVIEPGNTMLVFASSKDRAVNAAELHTNFTLLDSGGDLALVGPDGLTILDSFSPYSSQHADISYGKVGGTSQPLVPCGTSVKVQHSCGWKSRDELDGSCF